MALRITPSAATASTTASTLGAPSAPDIHDTLRSNLSLTSSSVPPSSASPTPAITSTHPLETRLAKWRATQDALKMEGLRRTFGMGEPIRRGMELKMAGAGEWRPLCLGGGSAGVHGDVLAGRDCEIGWEDVFTGGEMREVPDFHTEMEARFRMNW